MDKYEIADLVPDDVAVAWDDATAAISAGERVLLYGPPGTGKSYAARAADDRPVWALTLTEWTAAVDLFGGYVPGPHGAEWRDGPVLAAARAGGRVVLDEIDRAGPDAIPSLYAAADDPETIARVGLRTGWGDAVIPRPGYQVVATTNADPTDLPDALRSRFLTIRIPGPHPDAFRGLGDLMRAAASAVYSGAPDGLGDLRRWRAIARLTSAGIDRNRAARIVWPDADPYSIASAIEWAAVAGDA